MASSHPRILVLQHIPVEHPGIFRQFLKEDGIKWDAVELDAGDPIPDLAEYDGIWAMGGPMDVWEEDIHPWLVPEKAAIRKAVEEGKPFLGVCLGHQLLADALGGEVGLADVPEIGVMKVQATDEGHKSPFLQNIPSSLDVLQWHSAEVKRLPEGTRSLSRSPDCSIQSMDIGSAFSVQYHVEITPVTVSEWAEVPAYRRSLEERLGPDALGRFESDAAGQMDTFNSTAKTFYDNWMRESFG